MAPSEERQITYLLLYHPQFKDDIARLDRAFQARLEKAVFTRLTKNPQAFGKPLTRLLSGYWKLRLGDYRLVFRIAGNEIWIMGIIHRKVVYEQILRRLYWKPRP